MAVLDTFLIIKHYDQSHSKVLSAEERTSIHTVVLSVKMNVAI